MCAILLNWGFQGVDVYFVKGSGKTLRALLDEIHNDKTIRDSVSGKDKMAYKKLLANAQNEVVSYAKQFRVPVDQIDEKMVESINISGMFIIF